MDYGKVVGRAWQITWRWKVLWILGFLAALGRAIGSTSNSGYSTDSTRIPPEAAGILVALGCVALIFGIILWVVSVIARGGLIAGVQQAEEDGRTSFGDAWRVGAGRFWTLVGIGILASIPLIIAALVGGAGAIGLIVGGITLGDLEAGRVAALILPGISCGGLFCCGMVILAIILGQIRIYAERAAVLEGLGWLDAFARGWNILKHNLGHTIIYWLLFMGLWIFIGVIIFTIAMVVVLPFTAIVSSTDLWGWAAASVGCGGLLTIIVGAVFSAIVETFTSATWTLAYLEMAAADAAPVVPTE